MTRGRKGTPDRLLDAGGYQDGGCALAASCLDCPLIVCRYDHPQGVAGIEYDEKRRRVVSCVVQGMDVAAIVKRVGVSRRTVSRIMGGLPDGAR